MLTALPNYDGCEALANEMVTAIQGAFPALEAHFTNNSLDGPLSIEARNPLNGDCWTPVATVGPGPRNPSNTEVLIGPQSFGAAIAKFAGNTKKPVDGAMVCRTLVEYLKQERARQEQQILAQQAYKASNAAADKLMKELKKAGLPTDPSVPHLVVHGKEPSSYPFRDVAATTVAVNLRIEEGAVSPETAAKIIKLWKPIGKLLAEAPSVKISNTKSSCPAAGTLVN